MSDRPSRAAVSFFHGIGVRQVRITCGLILFAYLLSHFANHALGNVSYAAMEAGLEWHMRFWRYPVVVAAFYTAAITHWALGLWALYERRQFRYAGPEISQLVLGLSIPFLLVNHFVAVRLRASPLPRSARSLMSSSSGFRLRTVRRWRSSSRRAAFVRCASGAAA